MHVQHLCCKRLRSHIIAALALYSCAIWPARSEAAFAPSQADPPRTASPNRAQRWLQSLGEKWLLPKKRNLGSEHKTSKRVGRSKSPQPVQVTLPPPEAPGGMIPNPHAADEEEPEGATSGSGAYSGTYTRVEDAVHDLRYAKRAMLERVTEPYDTAERVSLLTHAFLRLVTPAAAEEEVDVVPENWQTPAVFGIGREKAHATLFPFESRELALLGNREHSERFLSLDGIWKFYWSVQ